MSLKNKILAKVLITCKEATLLACKEQEHAISLKEKIEMHLHLFFCTVCALFYKQSNHLHVCVKKLASEENTDELIQLDGQKRSSLEKIIKEGI